jgi:hypothetical protein
MAARTLKPTKILSENAPFPRLEQMNKWLPDYFNHAESSRLRIYLASSTFVVSSPNWLMTRTAIFWLFFTGNG